MSSGQGSGYRAMEIIISYIQSQTPTKNKVVYIPITVEGEKKGDTSSELKKERSFRFQEKWTHKESFWEALEKAWDETRTKNNITDQLKVCGEWLHLWAEKSFGSVRKKKKELYKETEKLSKRGGKDKEQKRMRAEKELDEIIEKEKTMWYQRTKALWMKDGDKNTKFFHQRATCRMRRNNISKMEDEQGIMVKK